MIKRTGFVEFACDKLQLSRATFYSWMKRGESGEEPYVSLLYDVRMARADKTATLQRKVEKTSDGAKWVLSKMQPQFGDKSVEAINQQFLEGLLPKLSPETAAQVLEALNDETPKLPGA